jgi:CubicO group peptidase (beta-lactamase class C family)
MSKNCMIGAILTLFGALAPFVAQDAMATSQDVRAVANSSARSLSFSGVLAVARGGTPIYEQAFGSADRENRHGMDMRTRFQVGSISKWFTAIVALKLVERGHLDLDAPIGRYLDSYPAEIGNRVSVAAVLSNTSGIKDRLPTELINAPSVAASPMTAAEAVHAYAEGPLTFKPGSKFDYSHTNWVLAQAIIERAGGKPFAVLLRDLVINPLGLKSTGVTHGSFEGVPDHAIAYESNAKGAARELHIIPGFLIPTGTIYSDCADLIRTAHGVYNGGLLNAASLKALDTIRWEPENYALGGRVKYRSLGGSKKTIAFEVGSFGGFKAVVEHVIDDDVTVVALNNTNMDEGDLGSLADKLLDAAYPTAK